jgi:hypothetical protein
MSQNTDQYRKALTYEQAKELQKKAPDTVVYVFYRNENNRRTQGEDMIKRFTLSALYFFGNLEIIVTEATYNQYFKSNETT